MDRFRILMMQLPDSAKAVALQRLESLSTDLMGAEATKLKRWVRGSAGERGPKRRARTSRATQGKKSATNVMAPLLVRGSSFLSGLLARRWTVCLRCPSASSSARSSRSGRARRPCASHRSATDAVVTNSTLENTPGTFSNRRPLDARMCCAWSGNMFHKT